MLAAVELDPALALASEMESVASVARALAESVRPLAQESAQELAQESARPSSLWRRIPSLAERRRRATERKRLLRGHRPGNREPELRPGSRSSSQATNCLSSSPRHRHLRTNRHRRYRGAIGRR